LDGASTALRTIGIEAKRTAGTTTPHHHHHLCFVVFAIALAFLAAIIFLIISCLHPLCKWPTTILMDLCSNGEPMDVDKEEEEEEEEPMPFPHIVDGKMETC